jgi:hypothetical protein
MADLLGVSQAEVSRMERRSELSIGTLRKFIEAMNGELVLAARFDDWVEVPIRLTHLPRLSRRVSARALS